MELALFESYFSKGENVSDIDTLGAVAGRIGLDESESRSVRERVASGEAA